MCDINNYNRLNKVLARTCMKQTNGGAVQYITHEHDTIVVVPQSEITVSGKQKTSLQRV